MSYSRRKFLKSAYAAGTAFTTLQLFNTRTLAYTGNSGLPLIPDPGGIIDLPKGFRYSVVSRTGGTMSDGFFRPGRPDGMACFPHPEDVDKCILLRNHENFPDMTEDGPFGEDNALLAQLPDGKLYDRRADGSPYIGGVTTTVYDLKNRRIERDHLSLAGTAGNCAGGATPWGSWLTCEETVVTPDNGAQKNHGYVFEVPALEQGLADPVPLKAMGRFVHEAAAVDPDTDIVYLTEDDLAGLFYRFLPDERKKLSQGGRLQALAIKGWRSADTRNWPRDWSNDTARYIAAGEEFDVEWIDMEDIDSPDGDLRERGNAAGAAVFCRGEGMAYGADEKGGAIYFNCTQGGAARTGQVWKYTPSAQEGQAGEKQSSGRLKLIYEAPDADTLDLCDNLAYAPWGDLILCEDGFGDQFLRGLTPDGKIYDLARNAHEDQAEFCGACFSPDGSVLFVNIQTPGFTLAIEGPWSSLRD